MNSDLFQEIISVLTPYTPNAEKATTAMFDHFCGRNVYFKDLGRKQNAEQRDSDILQEFNGANVAQLARKYRVTVKHVYQLIKRRNR